MTPTPKRKNADELIEMAKIIEGTAIKKILSRKRNWYGKTIRIEYQLITGDIKSEHLPHKFITSKSIYFSSSINEPPYLVIFYDGNGNISSIDEGWVVGTERKWDYNPYDFDGKTPAYEKGTHLKFYENGQLEYDMYFEPAGSLSGYYRAYHKNGNAAITGDSVNSGAPRSHSPSGEWVWYFENGKIGKVINFKKGFCVGDLILYDKNGNIEEKKKFTEKDKYTIQQLTPRYFQSHPMFYIEKLRGNRHIY